MSNTPKKVSGSTKESSEAPHTHSYLESGDTPLIQLHRGLVAYNLFQSVFQNMEDLGFNPRGLVLEFQRLNSCGDNASDFTNALHTMLDEGGWSDKGPFHQYPDQKQKLRSWIFVNQQMIMDLGRFFVNEDWNDCDRLVFDDIEFNDGEPESYGGHNWERFPDLCMQLGRFLEFLGSEELRKEYWDGYHPEHHCPVTSSFHFALSSGWRGEDVDGDLDDFYIDHPESDAWDDILSLCPDCWLNHHCKMLVPDEKSISNLDAKVCGCTVDEDESIVCLMELSHNLTREPKHPLRHLKKNQMLLPQWNLGMRQVTDEVRHGEFLEFHQEGGAE